MIKDIENYVRRSLLLLNPETRLAVAGKKEWNLILQNRPRQSGAEARLEIEEWTEMGGKPYASLKMSLWLGLYVNAGAADAERMAAADDAGALASALCSLWENPPESLWNVSALGPAPRLDSVLLSPRLNIGTARLSGIQAMLRWHWPRPCQ